MSKFLINGGKSLNGEIKVQGSKNAATKMMVASLLTDEECILENFPQIGDTEITADLCRSLGSKTDIKNGTARIKTQDIKNPVAVLLTRRNRIPILTLGPLLARTGRAEVPVLGGDKIGPRPVNLHLKALMALGAEIEILEDRFRASAPQGLKGARIQFKFPSVGATENAILAAVLANGKTTIKNAAIEPEVIDLIKMLQKMGAIIGLGANRTIYIEGVKKLKGTIHRLLPDRNEAVSFACLAAASGGKVKIRDALQEHLITFLNALRKIGGEYSVEDDGIAFWRNGKLISTEIETDTHPGFMTDWQQPFAVLLTQAEGVSVVHETIYEDRFGYAEDLNLMGANIKVFSKCLGELSCRFNGKGYGHSAVISGPTSLKGSRLKVRDLRSGIAHIIAALIAEGKSEIEGVEEIDRGYERLDERLRNLGAGIKRIES
jgi:UDP-N-acetylglucosamine 1-carboxyvinyltransferase